MLADKVYGHVVFLAEMFYCQMPYARRFMSRVQRIQEFVSHWHAVDHKWEGCNLGLRVL